MKKILLLGSGALQIGQAGEFDYSGSQAIKACKKEGVEVVLINPNIATNQTSDDLADKVYFLPINLEFVTKVIEKERPDGIMLAWGGQTALNTGIELKNAGILKKYNVKVLGTPVEVIEKTEDRKAFNDELEKINIKYPKSIACQNHKEAEEAIEKIGFPVIIRAAFTLGGGGSGFAENQEEFKNIINKAFSFSSQILVEESLKGWKEIEYEVVRDKEGNKITVCNMENFDPLGIHTGESIVIAPSQTLNDEEYQKLRNIALKVIEHLGIVGECNIQYAFDPNSNDYRVIEVNARLSRSSALASKATGYPLAFVAAEIALGKNLYEIKNSITGKTMAMFEPSLDYVALKIPRWDLNKFRKINQNIGSEMKSVGEIMSIGRSFEEVLQKGLRMLQIGVLGVSVHPFEFKDLISSIKNPTPKRIFAIYDLIRKGEDIKKISEITGINMWFLNKLKNIHNMENKISKWDENNINKNELLEAKKFGFSDASIEKIINKNIKESDIRKVRKDFNIFPCVKKIDTLAAEFPSETNYMYMTYHGNKNDINITELSKSKKILVLGSGPYSIGSSVEFDWSCVNTVKTLKKEGYEVAMLNSNPETVSTDYETCDFLFFDELSLERSLDIIDFMNPEGTIIYAGGQVPNNLSDKLGDYNIKILGTDSKDIHRAESRQIFSGLCDKLNIDQPLWEEFNTPDEAKNFSNKVGYPVLVRPSKVLSGAAMAVARNDEELIDFLGKASKVVDKNAPVVVSKFEIDAREIEIDAVAFEGELIIHAISEHIENAGVHSGDATIVMPPQKTYLETIRRIKNITKKLAKELNITGPFNMQFLAKENAIKVIELNLRASRSFPFVSKVTGINFIEVATLASLGKVQSKEYRRKYYKTLELDHVCVKCPQFSFSRLSGADPVLSVEMASTGEVACFGNSFEEAFLKSMISVGFKRPKKGILFSIGGGKSKASLTGVCKFFQDNGHKIYATEGTAKFFEKEGIDNITTLKKADNGNDIIELIKSKEIDMIVNIPNKFAHEEKTSGYKIRRAAIDNNMPLITNVQVAKALKQSLKEIKSNDDLRIQDWKSYIN